MIKASSNKNHGFESIIYMYIYSVVNHGFWVYHSATYIMNAIKMRNFKKKVKDFFWHKIRVD
jgi:hypothetical protein